MANRKHLKSQEASLTIRLETGRKEELEQYAKLYNRNTSDLVRESISLWLNLQTPKGKEVYESLLPQNR